MKPAEVVCMYFLSFCIFLQARKRSHHPGNTAVQISSTKYPLSLGSSPLQGHKAFSQILCHVVTRMAISIPVSNKTSSLLRLPGKRCDQNYIHFEVFA
jgi:hypothetical protein